MSLYFLINNARFAIELTGAVTFFIAAWLTYDTYNFRKDSTTLVRAIGLGLCAVAQTITAINLGNDILSYLGFIFFALGLLAVLSSFLKSQQLQVHAVLVIPAFTLWQGYLVVVLAFLSGAVAFLSYRRAKQELNNTWTPFSIALGLVGVGLALSVVAHAVETSPLFIAGLLSKLVGFGYLARWVWQFLQLRIRESLVLIFTSVALLLSTVVTLAFSTILISQLSSQTEANLITDARVLDLHLQSLHEESLAKAALIATNKDVAGDILANDFSALSQTAETLMETYNLGLLTIADEGGAVLVRAHALSKRGDSIIGARTFEEALHGNSFVTIEENSVEKLAISAGAPIMQKDKIIGVVIAGYPLDNALVDSVKRITGLEMFIYTGSVSSAATALAADGRTRLTGEEVTDPVVRATVLVGGKTTTAQANFYGQPYLASYIPLKNGDGKIIGMISAGKPQQDILDIANSTNRLTLITIILIMLILALPIYLFTKRLTQET